MTDTPLASASPDSLTILFEADPLTLSDAQILAAVVELRRRRNVFTAEEAAKSLKPRAKRTVAEAQSPEAAAALNKPAGELSLDDLA